MDLNDSFDIGAFSRGVMVALKKAEEDLYKKAMDGKVSISGKDVMVERDNEIKQVRKEFSAKETNTEEK